MFWFKLENPIHAGLAMPLQPRLKSFWGGTWQSWLQGGHSESYWADLGRHFENMEWSVYIWWTLRVSAMQGGYPILKIYSFENQVYLWYFFGKLMCLKPWVPESLHNLRDWWGTYASSVYRINIVTMTQCRFCMVAFIIYVWSLAKCGLQH